MAEELAREIIYVLLAVMVVIAAIAGCTRVYKTITEGNQQQQALGTLDSFMTFISELKENQVSSFLIYAPKDYYFVTSGNSACICETTDCSSDKKWCKDLSKPIRSDKIYIKIRVGTFIITNSPDNYLLETYEINNVEEKEVNVLSDKCYGDLVNVEGNFQLRSSVVPIFKQAQEIAAKNGVELILNSAYRTKEQQQDIFNQYKDPIRVCNPDSAKGTCPHMTGCAVDVCIKSLCQSGLPGNLDNADTKLLETIMAQAGFVRYANEFWHFEYGTTRWQTCMAQNAVACV